MLENIKTLKIQKDQYLKDILKEIPSNTIIYKTLTGVGATTLEIESERHSIIIVPNIPVIQGKCDTYNTRTKIRILGVCEGVTVDKIIDYLCSPVKYKKLIITPEAFPKVKEAIDEVNKESVGFNLYNDFFLLFDECERAIQDVSYRGKIVLPMNDFFTFQNKAFVSATPILPTDPRFKRQNFKILKIDPQFDYSQNLLLVLTNNIVLTLKKFIADNPRDQYFIFFKSTDTIAHLIKSLALEDDSMIFCAKESKKKLKVNEFKSTVSTSLMKFKKFNFFTSRFFSAVDIENVKDPTIIMITDLVCAGHSMIDPISEAVQIVGRFRKPEDGEIIKEVVHISNTNIELISRGEEEVRKYLQECWIFWSMLTPPIMFSGFGLR